MKINLQVCYLNRHAARTGRLTRGPWRAKRRSASVLLELIVGLPILVIIVVASVQFGLYFQNMQQVALASRVGAHKAAETALPNEGDVADDPVPNEIVTAITQQLSSAGIEPCAIILEHAKAAFIGPFSPDETLRTDFASDCPDCKEPSSAIPRRTVRVTVCVKMDELMPNCLKMFGFDISTYTSESSTTVSYELP